MKTTKNKLYLRMARTLVENPKTLNECYKKPSIEKRKIYFKCVSLAKEHNALYYGIISSNTYSFTFGYVWEHNNELCAKLILPTKTKVVNLADLERLNYE